MEKKLGASADVVIEKLQEAITLHFTALKGIPVGFSYLRNLNPELLLRIITDLLEYAPQQVSVGVRATLIKNSLEYQPVNV